MRALTASETWHPWQKVAGARSARLDGLRAFAILPVVLFHSTLFTETPSGAGSVLATLTAMGTSGVDLFFVLSGFLITGILVESRGADNYYRAFYARRTLRIFPLYYAVVAFCLVALPYLSDAPENAWMPGADQEEWWYWVYMTNFHIASTGRPHHYLLAITWSLAIEEQFYLVWPLVVAWCSRKRLVQISAAMVGIALVTRLVLLAAGATNSTIHTFPLCRVDSLAIGALIALLSVDPGSRAWLVRCSSRLLPIAGGVYLTYVFIFPFVPSLRAGALGRGIFGGDDPAAMLYSQHPLHMTLGYTVLALIFGALLVRTLAAGADSRWTRLLEWTPLVRIGQWSYAIYLLHLIAADLVRSIYDPYAHLDSSFLVAQLTFYAWVLTVSILLGAASTTFFEGPIMRLKRLFPYRWQAGERA